MTDNKNLCGKPGCQNINSGIDEYLKPIIEALNSSGVETIASCCGHGNTLGSIALRDGREIILAPDFETARRIFRDFPDIHGDMI